MINLFTRYPGKVGAPSSDYPSGVAQNITTPGDGTGTPWEKDLVNDFNGLFQALLSSVGESPSTFSEKVGASQLLQAIVSLSSGLSNVYTDIGIANAYVVNLPSAVQPPAAEFNGLVIRFKPLNDNTGASTINVAGFGVKAVVDRSNNPLIGGELMVGFEARLIFNLANDNYELASTAKSVTRQVFIASGTYNKPPGVRQIRAQVQAAGGGGGGADGPGGGGGIIAAAGAASGEYREGIFNAADLLAAETVTIGAGGLGGTDDGANGSSGGDSSLGALITTGGGPGASGSVTGVTIPQRGVLATNTGIGGTGGIGGDININGQAGGIGSRFGGSNTGISGEGADSFLGLGGKGNAENQPSILSTGFGGGGSGASTANTGVGQAGAVGGNGVVIITEFYE